MAGTYGICSIDEMTHMHYSRLMMSVMAEHKNTCPDIDRVIVNKPAVIVYWKDGTKTVVKKQKGDKWDPEKGVAMAICKRLHGNTGRYNDVIKRALEGAVK